ncbi:hypothetical protein WAI453_004744 [Rhynchosporium graminicola]|uniref:Uncharacterized protein n=1 Tax=Rhynchosporium graminicola TaxID=2792576 RepID=A0A1E1LGE1_9HELO|nr:uncharacterized protein RCO7_03688 [Rhynchosporium commune]
MSPRQVYRGRDPRRLNPDSAIITPQKLTFKRESHEIRTTPSAPKRRLARVEGTGSRYSVLRDSVLKGDSLRCPFRKPSVEVARKPRRLGTLGVLPYELILNIIRKLEEGAQELHYQRVQDFGLVCLALTSTDFYKICKYIHPLPLPTTRGDGIRDEKYNFWAWSLERHIGDFLGPMYQVRDRDPRYGFYTRIGSPFLLKGADLDSKVSHDVDNILD